MALHVWIRFLSLKITFQGHRIYVHTVERNVIYTLRVIVSHLKALKQLRNCQIRLMSNIPCLQFAAYMERDILTLEFLSKIFDLSVEFYTLD